VITTEDEKDKIDFDKLVTDEDPDVAVARPRGYSQARNPSET